MQSADAVQALLRAGQMAPGVYTVKNVPEVSLGELVDEYEKKGFRFSERPLRVGEAMKENLVDIFWERLESTECPYISRVVKS